MNKVKLGYILKIFNGKAHLSLEKVGDFPVFGSGGLMGYTNDFMYKGEAILLPRKGTLSNIQYLNEEFWVVDTTYYAVVDKKKANTYFVWNYLKVLNLENLNSGSAVPSMTQSAYQEIEIILPNLQTQTAIANTLSSLDNKIELNNKINRELENLAKTIYEYWFVQNAEESWERKKIGEIAEIVNGATPSTSDSSNYNGEIVWITPKDLSSQQSKFTYYGERSITQKGFNSCNTTLVPINSILLSSRAPIGLLSIAKVELCTNQGFKVIVPFEEKMSSYLYYYLQSQIDVIQHLGAGTTFKEVSKNTLSEFSVICPTTDILEKWGNFINPIFEKQFEIAKENIELARQRDFLLPLLMNGQVVVQTHSRAS